MPLLFLFLFQFLSFLATASKLRIVQEFTVNLSIPSYSSKLLQDYLITSHPDLFPSMSAIKRNIRNGLIRVNHAKVMLSDRVEVSQGQVITVLERAEQGSFLPHNLASAFTLPVHFEDDDLAVVEKPFHMPMFSATTDLKQEKQMNGSLPSLHTSLLVSLLPIQSKNDPSAIPRSPLHRPQPVHRLDTLTGGLVLVAKTKPALVAMSKLFSSREVVKIYLAIVVGTLHGEGHIHQPIDGQPAHSFYRSLGTSASVSFGTISTVEVTLFTGRNHQIRKHLRFLGHPIVGDPRYSFDEDLTFSSKQVMNKRLTK